MGSRFQKRIEYDPIAEIDVEKIVVRRVYGCKVDDRQIRAHVECESRKSALPNVLFPRNSGAYSTDASALIPCVFSAPGV